MKTINDIIRSYTAGEADLETTNAALAEAGAGYHLEPGRNEITDRDRRQTTVGYYPEQALGWGLLDTGTGSLDRARVQFGHLDNPINEVMPDGSVNMAAYFYICGKEYAVLGNKLAEIPEEDRETYKAPSLPDKADLRRRADLAGQMVEQKTKSGIYRVTYDAQGYAIRSVKKEVI